MTAREIALEIMRQEGKKEGSQEQQIFFVENLLYSTDYEDEKIAWLAGVSLEFIK